MNKLTYSREVIETQFGQVETLGEIFAAVEKDLLSRGEIVCRFMVNGLAFTELDEKKFAEYELGDVKMIEVESESPDILLEKVIDNWIESLPKMIGQSDDLAGKLRMKGIENNLSAFVSLVDSCQFLIESLISLRTLCREQTEASGTNWKLNEEVTARTIGEALTVFEKKDFVLLADILEYDLGHCLQSWLESLILLKGNVHSTATDSISDQIEKES